MNFKGSDCKGVWHKTAGISGVVIADSDITSARVSCMQVIKIGGVIEELGKMERNFPTSCNGGPASLLVVRMKGWQLPRFQRTIGIRMSC